MVDEGAQRASVAAPAAGGAGTQAGGEGAPAAPARRRRGQQEVQEVIDELAQETKRTSLLERVETQLKGQFHVSRLLCGFHVADDRKIHAQIEEEFAAWRQKQEGQAEDLSGLLLFTSHGAVQFLEGPTELLFAALAFFNSLTAEVADVRPALISPVRVLHFTELHGTRSARMWCTIEHGGKLQGGTQVALEETNAADFMYKVYQKMMFLCLRVKEQLADDDEADTSDALSAYKKAAEMLPTVDDVSVLLGKAASDFFFSFEEFQKVFVAPFNLVLHSELLWPMAPALSY